MIGNYFKTAIRYLLRNKGYSLINIAGLSLGLACSMLIMLYVKDEASYDRFHKNAGRIFRIDRKINRPDGSIARSGYSGYPQGPAFKQKIPEIRSFLRLQQTQMDIKKGNDIQSQPVTLVDSNFFSEFSFPLLKGNARTVLSSPNSVVITEDMAKKQFGHSDVLGKIIMLKAGDQFVPYAVSGVAGNCPQNSSIKFQVLLSLMVSPEEQNSGDPGEGWFHSFLNSFVVVGPNVNAKTLEAKMQRVYETDAKESIKAIQNKYGIKDIGLSYFLQPLTDIHLSKEIPADEGLADGSNPMFSYILSGIALFILVIACINFVNLSIARSLKRSKEIGIRKVVGGERRQLMIQFLGESSLLCFIAFALALIMVQGLLPLFNQLSNKALALSYLMDLKLVSGFLILFVVTTLLSGFYPALVLSGYNPVTALYSRFNIAGKNYLQKSLVVLQFCLASFLIIATLTIFFQFNFLTTQKLGYDDTNLVMVEKWGINHEVARLFGNELKKDPNIIGVAPRNGGYSGNTVRIKGETLVTFTYETVDESYIPLLKIPVLKGRNFSADYPSDSTHAVLVNEEFAKQAGWSTPIGQTINFFDEPGRNYNVVGMVKDYHFKPLTTKIEPQLFTMNPASEFGMFYIKIRPGSETASLRHIGEAFRKFFPVSPFNFAFSEEVNRNKYEAEAKWKQIMLFGAIITIFISCIGLFGLSVLSAEKRIKEIGIRKVLGASVGNLVTTLSGEFLKLIIIALIISIPLAWLSANRWLENYPYRISLSWVMFATDGLLVIFIALATVGYQSVKAALTNPVNSLRSV